EMPWENDDSRCRIRSSSGLELRPSSIVSTPHQRHADLLCELSISFGAHRIGSICSQGKSMAGRLSDPNVAWNNRLERGRKVHSDLVDDLPGERCSGVKHGHDDP